MKLIALSRSAKLNNYRDNSQYRADIDGLRGIAVLSVILFHINPELLTGGFLGVDIFFVLSGFLITNLLVKSVEKHGRLDLVGFYVRRIRRIIPALMFLVFCVYIFGYFFLAPPDFSSLSLSSIWALLSAANIYYFLYLDEGYFAADSAEQPLLHLWSLGVEEQFYLIWPFYVFILCRTLIRPSTRMWVTMGVVVSSLVLAQMLITPYHSFAYYMLPTRSWELAAGGVLVFSGLQNAKPPKWLGELLALVGLVSILFSLVYVTESHDVPGFAAVPVVLGTTLLIYAGLHQQTFINRIVSTKALVLVGLVSYSAYLWHWPIIAFLKYSSLEITTTIGISVILATFFFAILSYQMVERPLRYFKTSNRNILVGYFLAPLLTMSALCFAALLLIRTQSGWLYDWSKYQVITNTQPAFEYEYNCQQTNFDVNQFYLSRCVYPQGQEPTVLLAGDSIAAQYLGAFRVLAKHYGFSLRNLTQSSCPLLTEANDLHWVDRKYRDDCIAYLKFLSQQLSSFDTIIVGGSWATYEKKGEPYYRKLMAQTIDKLAKEVENIVIMGKNPNFSGYQAACEQRQVKLGFMECDASRYNKPVSRMGANEFLRELSEKYDNVHYYDIAEHLCVDGTCSPFKDGQPLYYDSLHLSMEGSKYLGKHMLTTGSGLLNIMDSIFQ